MYKDHPVFLDPEKPFELLWRYMDWPRFFLLLKSSKLFFPCARVLQEFDQFEGSLPKKELEGYLKELKWTVEVVHRAQNKFRNETFVSCWHYNDSESIAMWKLYAPTGNGIAIQTTIPEFKLAFANSGEDVYAGQVRYIDYDTETFCQDEERDYPFISGFVPFIHKRQIFTHEREYRAIVWRVNLSESQLQGLDVKVDLRLLVKRVVVAPKTPQWILNAVRLVLDELLPGVEAERSVGDLTPDV
jgi:hypothetical protein